MGITGNKGLRVEVYEDNDIDKFLVPTKFLQEGEKYTDVIFHIQKEICRNGLYKFHLFIDNSEKGEYSRVKIFKYGESIVSKEVFHKFNGPLVIFVLSVSNLGNVQFQPIGVSIRKNTSP